MTPSGPASPVRPSPEPWYARPMMTKPRLTYFDAPVSRGEECRLALHLAGVDFEDVRIRSADWPALKERMPYGALPVLELPGCPPLAHSNAILVLIGRRHGLHPADDVEAALHEGMMEHVEALRAAVSPTLRMVVLRVRSACGNFSKLNRGIFTTV